MTAAEEPKTETAVERVNSVLSRLTRCEVRQLALLEGAAPDKRLTVGCFHISPISGTDLAHKVEAFDLPFTADNGIALMREPRDIQLLVPALRESATAQESGADLYFAAVSELLFEDFWIAFRDAQVVPVALGAPLIDDETLRHSQSLHAVTLYSYPGGPEWITVQKPIAPVPRLETARDVALVEAALLEAGHDLRSADSDVGKTIITFARFVARAEHHRQRGYANEGFLHYVIALDLLLGSTESSTTTVASRGAMIVAGTQGKSFREQEREIRNFYNQRSRYVHRGDSVDPDTINSIRAICQEVLHALIRLRAAVELSPTADPVRRWHQRLDYLVKAAEAGKTVPRADFTECGIARLPLRA